LRIDDCGIKEPKIRNPQSALLLLGFFMQSMLPAKFAELLQSQFVFALFLASGSGIISIFTKFANQSNKLSQDIPRFTRINFKIQDTITKQYPLSDFVRFSVNIVFGN